MEVQPPSSVDAGVPSRLCVSSDLFDHSKRTVTELGGWTSIFRATDPPTSQRHLSRKGSSSSTSPTGALKGSRAFCAPDPFPDPPAGANGGSSGSGSCAVTADEGQGR